MVTRLLRAFERVLTEAERRVALLSRVRAVNASAERARLLTHVHAHRVPTARFRYAPGPRLDDVRRALETVAARASEAGVIGELYAERAIELELEARLVEAIGEPAFRDLARARYGRARAEDADWADAIAATWATLVAAQEEGVPSDDASDPRSLVSRLHRRLGSLRLPVRVVVAELDSLAATGDGVVYVARGRLHSPTASMRLALHEVDAHVVPRVAARAEDSGLYRVGTAGSTEDEEGRALVLEEDAGHLDDARRRQLGLRHVAAALVGRGADWSETAHALLGLGAGAEEAVDIASRAHRGGGLAREIAYLPAFRRARRELRSAEVAAHVVRGRIGFSAARVLAESSGEHSRGMTEGRNCLRSGRADV